MMSFQQLSRRRFLTGSLAVGAASLSSRTLTAASEPSERHERGADVWQIGCYTRPWVEHDYRAAFDAIAEAGFKYVGLMSTKSPTRLVISSGTTHDEARQVGEETKKRGLKVASVYGGGIPVEKSVEAGIEVLRKLVDNCAAVGAANLLMGGIGDPKRYDAYYKAIAACCGYAAEKKLGISIKPHGGLNATGPQCRKAIELVGHRNFRLWYDPGNIYYYSDGKLDPVEDAATVDGLVVGMAVKDYLPPKNVNVTPGTGKVDFPAVMARLKKGGFTHGPLIVETLAPGDLKHLLTEAKKAKSFLEDLTAGRIATTRPQ